MKSWTVHQACDLQVLLFEDDSKVAETLSAYLREWSCSVTRVTTGLDGVKALLWANFDFVICDLTIPSLPYQALYKAVVRLRPRLCERFIFISGHAADPGVDSFTRHIRGLTLWEPFDMYDLASAMRAVMRKAGKRSGYRDSAGLAFAMSADFETSVRGGEPAYHGSNGSYCFAHQRGGSP